MYSINREAALTTHSWDFPSSTNWTCLLLRNEEKGERVKNWPQIPKDLSFWRRSPWQILSNTSNISTVNASTTSKHVKSPGHSISYNYQNVCSWMRFETILKMRKMISFLKMIKKPIFYRVFSLCKAEQLLTSTNSLSNSQQTHKLTNHRSHLALWTFDKLLIVFFVLFVLFHKIKNPSTVSHRLYFLKSFTGSNH